MFSDLSPTCERIHDIDNVIITVFAIAFDQLTQLFKHSPYQGHRLKVPVIHRKFKQLCPLIDQTRSQKDVAPTSHLNISTYQRYRKTQAVSLAKEDFDRAQGCLTMLFLSSLAMLFCSRYEFQDRFQESRFLFPSSRKSDRNGLQRVGIAGQPAV